MGIIEEITKHLLLEEKHKHKIDVACKILYLLNDLFTFILGIGILGIVGGLEQNRVGILPAIGILICIFIGIGILHIIRRAFRYIIDVEALYDEVSMFHKEIKKK